MSTAQAWEDAYRRTQYHVLLARGDLVLRIGVRHADDARLREEAGVREHWAIVTPCNPLSQRLAEKDNAALLAQFKQAIAELELRAIVSANHDPSGQWPDEPGLLLCDPPPGVAEELGRRYRQNAIVTGKLGEAPRLVWLQS